MQTRFARSVMFLALAATSANAQPEPTTPPDAAPAPAPGDTAPAAPTADPIEPAVPPEPSRRRTTEAAKPREIDPAPPPSTESTPATTRRVNELAPEPALPYVRRLDRQHGFRFGSYGRVIAGTDLRGGKPESANVVAHGPRIVEPSYLELDFSYGFDTPSGKVLRPVVTLAFDSTLFHDTGDFDAQPALRNVYLDAQVTKRLGAWVGSRMYRGDDIYLFDYWPLDDLNTVGGGLVYRRQREGRHGEPLGDLLELAAHAGVNRLNREFQFQEIDVPDPEQGATTITQLNRQRMVASGSASYILDAAVAAFSLKLKVHGELHALPSGTRRRVDGTFEDLPADNGFLIGTQVGMFEARGHPKFRRHLNVFARYAKGLAAFDELAPPTSFGADLETNRANEVSFGASGNWDHELGNVMLGALSRRFIDADGAGADHDDGWEYAVNLRPLVRVPRSDAFVGADLSYQARFPRGINPNTLRAEDPAVFQIAPMLVYSPMGPSGYDRPQIRVVYRAAHRNDAARDLFVPDDPRREHRWTHFLGLQAEWWFNSSTYR